MRARPLPALPAAFGCDPVREPNRDCGGDTVCARNGECLPASGVRTLRLTWTVGGQPASTATCTRMPDLQVYFHVAADPNDAFRFPPVPCGIGSR